VRNPAGVDEPKQQLMSSAYNPYNYPTGGDLKFDEEEKNNQDLKKK
jgi:hypothetical protein